MLKKILAGGIILLAFLTIQAAQCHAMEPPASATLDSIANLFSGVTFDHASHVDIAGGDCTLCHHHTTGPPPTDPRCARCHANSPATAKVDCKSCHVAAPFSADNLKAEESSPLRYHQVRLGLKGAYHRRCLGCHKENGAPTGCEDCHQKTDKGEAFYHSGKYAPPPQTSKGTGEED